MHCYCLMVFLLSSNHGAYNLFLIMPYNELEEHDISPYIVQMLVTHPKDRVVVLIMERLLQVYSNLLSFPFSHVYV